LPLFADDCVVRLPRNYSVLSQTYLLVALRCNEYRRSGPLSFRLQPYRDKTATYCRVEEPQDIRGVTQAAERPVEGRDMQIKRSTRAAVIFASVASLAGAASAQTPSDSSQTLDSLVACQAIHVDQTRLACLDTATAQIIRARKSGNLLALDRGKVIEQKRRWFGLADAGQNPLGGGEADRLTKVTEIETTITSIKPAGYARFALQLANGTVWQTIEPLTLAPQPGTALMIKQSGFGGFKATIKGERPILVKRQR
jgi:hypothetical protein